MQITHVAFSDESDHNQKRFRSIALVSMKIEILDKLRLKLINALYSSDLYGKELKWEKIRNAKYRFAALKFLSILYPHLLNNDLRIDSIIWDTYDVRHSIKSRDDKKNFSIMYYHQLFDCLNKRWPLRSLWGFFPDESSIVDWDEFLKIMENSAPILLGKQKAIPQLSTSRYSYRIIDFCQIKSINEPLIQAADLFCGLGACSCNKFSELYIAIREITGQPSLFKSEIQLSNSDIERAYIVLNIINFCKAHNMQVSFESTNGFLSHNPSKPLNFWRYSPQHFNDKAPIIKS